MDELEDKKHKDAHAVMEAKKHTMERAKSASNTAADQTKIQGTTKPQPFHCMLGRDAMDVKEDDLRWKKKGTPPVGIYNPKQVLPKTHAIRRYEVERAKPFEETIPKKDKITQDDLSYNPSKLPSKVKGNPCLDKKTDRLSAYGSKRDLNDSEGKQFLYLDIPSVSTKHR